MRNKTLGTLLGMGLCIVPSCTYPGPTSSKCQGGSCGAVTEFISYVPKIEWLDAAPRQIEIKDLGNERKVIAERKFFDYIYEGGYKKELIFIIEKDNVYENKWTLREMKAMGGGTRGGASEDEMLEILSRKLPNFAHTVKNARARKEIMLEDVYEGERLREVKIYLPRGPSGIIETYSLE